MANPQDIGRYPGQPSALSSFPIGAMLPMAFPPSDGSWMYGDNSAQSKGSYPAYPYPAGLGTFTPTSRTPGATPASNAGDSDGTIWAIAGASGASAIQTTPDGVTYTGRTTPAATVACSIRHLSGNNWICAVSGSAQPLYSADGAATWVAATGAAAAATGAQQCCTAYAPTRLGTGNGRVIQTAGTATVYTSDDLGHTYTAQATGLGVNLFNICDTGTQFVATTSSTTQYAVSTTGLAGSWSLVKYQAGTTTAASATSKFIESDGAGHVVIFYDGSFPYGGMGIFASSDNGNTFQNILLPAYGMGAYGGATLLIYGRFTNGRFMAAGTNGGGIAYSIDGKSWQVIQDNTLQIANSTFPNFIYRSSGVYLVTGATGTLTTLVEDTTKFYLPGQPGNGTAAQQPISMPYYVKVK